MDWSKQGRFFGVSNKFVNAIKAHQKIYDLLLQNQNLLRALAYVNPFDDDKEDITLREAEGKYIVPKTFEYDVIQDDYSQVFLETTNGLFPTVTKGIHRWSITIVTPNRNEVIKGTSIPRNLYIAYLVASTLEVTGISTGQPNVLNYDTIRINPAHTKTELTLEMELDIGRTKDVVSIK